MTEIILKISYKHSYQNYRNNVSKAVTEIKQSLKITMKPHVSYSYKLQLLKQLQKLVTKSNNKHKNSRKNCSWQKMNWSKTSFGFGRLCFTQLTTIDFCPVDSLEMEKWALAVQPHVTWNEVEHLALLHWTQTPRWFVTGKWPLVSGRQYAHLCKQVSK